MLRLTKGKHFANNTEAAKKSIQSKSYPQQSSYDIPRSRFKMIAKN